MDGDVGPEHSIHHYTPWADNVNYLKAGVSLDAATKIYSHRVDDCYKDSIRYMENLGRGNDLDRQISQEPDEFLEG